MKVIVKNMLLFLLLTLGLLCDRAWAELQVFASFEEQLEIKSIRSSSGVRIGPSTRFPAWEGSSLEVISPEGGGSIEISQIPPDWRWQESLLVFVWSQQPSDVALVLQDSIGANYRQSFRVRPGANHLQLRLAEAKTVNLQVMRSLTVAITTKGTFYFDYFALDRFHPVLQQRGRWDINYSLDVETPHVPWARPLAGGPIKVFAIADVADGRGIVELAQRLDLDFKATTIGKSAGINKWGFGDFYEQRGGGGELWANHFSLAYTYIADDLIYGPRYDVILWPGLHAWNSYPEEVRGAIRRRVEEGAGLVLFEPNNSDGAVWDPSPLIRSASSVDGKKNPDDDGDTSRWEPTGAHYITRGIAWEAFPWTQLEVPASTVTTGSQVLLQTAGGHPVLAIRSYGKGRIVALGYREKGMIPAIKSVFETGLDYPYHDYLWALVARAVVWAAHREPAAELGPLVSTPSGAEAQVKSAPPNSELRVTVRNSFGETEVDELQIPVSAEASARIPFPPNPGLHLFEVRLTDQGKVLDWAASLGRVPSPVVLTSVKPGTDRVRVGEAVPVVVKLRSPQEIRCSLEVRLFDNYERLLDRQSVPLSFTGKAEQTVNLKTNGALTHLAIIDCQVLVNGTRSDRQKAEVFVLQPRKWDDYDIVMYRFGPDPIPGIWPAIDRQMRRLNVTTLSSYSVTNSKHANYNVQAQTRISGQESPDGESRKYYTEMKRKYLATGDKRVLAREHCLDDPGYRELVIRELRELTQPWVPFSPMSYYVYEEPSLTCYGDAVDLCFAPTTMAAMRRWLKDTYGGLDQLNQQWETSFTSWDEVVPDDAPEAQKRGIYSSWADHRTYMEKTYADSFAFVLEELRKIDPEGILLNSGTQISGSHNGCDYSRINRYTRHLNAYDGGNQLDFHRCFNPELKISGGAGYGVLGKDVFYNFYSNLFKGANGGAYIFWQYSTLDPDLTMSQSGKDMEEGFRELRGEGIGKLVGLATPANNGIAIHYSYPSMHAAWIVDGKMKEEVSYNTSKSFDRFNDNRDGWVKILRDSGLQFDFLAYGDLENGALLKQGYRIFVLPMSYALSDKEVRAIRDFVAGGGTVIADALPGIMDEHCRFREARPLLDVFGIDAPSANQEAILRAAGEPTLRTRRARLLDPAAAHPSLLAHEFGKGRGYFLNYFMDSYPQAKLEKKTGPLLARFSRVLEDAEIRPIIRLTTLDGRPVSDCATYLLNTGKTQLLGLIPDPKKPQESIRVQLQRTAAVYDVRKRQYLGSASAFDFAIEPAAPVLLALLEKPISGVTVSAPSEIRLGEEIQVDIKVQGNESLRSTARMTVTNPHGVEVPYYGGNFDIAANEAQMRFRTALSDAPGRWKVAITEVISGKNAEAEIEVR